MSRTLAHLGIALVPVLLLALFLYPILQKGLTYLNLAP